MSEKEIQEIIYAAMENFSASDPPDPILPEHWVLTETELRSMLGFCIEIVRERMLDPVAVGRKIAELSVTRFALDGREVSAEECVDVLIKQRDEARMECSDLSDGVAALSGQLPVVRSERDEARDAAREAVRLLCLGCPDDQVRWEKDYPWLKETP